MNDKPVNKERAFISLKLGTGMARDKGISEKEAYNLLDKVYDKGIVPHLQLYEENINASKDLLPYDEAKKIIKEVYNPLTTKSNEYGKSLFNQGTNALSQGANSLRQNTKMFSSWGKGGKSYKNKKNIKKRTKRRYK